MAVQDYGELRALEQALDAIERDARALIDGITDAQGVWRADLTSWSIAHCLDHLATANRVYLQAMTPPAGRALQQGRRRRGPAVPGLIGGWFVRSMEPPVRPRFRMKAPKKIIPRESPPLRDAAALFLTSHDEVRAFLREFADIDLAHVVFPNPFIRGVRFSLATGLYVLEAHERRHLWQAWNVRAGAVGERASGAALPVE
jgi:hypothetical protein